ncbi:MAG: 23S rRNA (adenine(2503)-C(2))-methyltransferase RlmN, partial [Actinobacteria bacterium]|nr:23S rRNA (adenine(2503)-C(2))-methyltransferase RlmN [Actinomycetota bacterium]
MPTIYDASRDELAAVLDGAPAYRIEQAWHGLYRDLRPAAEIGTLPKALRARLTEALPEALVAGATTECDGGTTRKYLWRLADGGHPIESVLMHYRDRSTVCVSTQAGCAMACGFCA